MYAVVGCTDCSSLWVVEGRPETTECPRCGTRHRFERLRAFVETEEKAAATRARAAMLADRQDQGDAFADVAADLEVDLDATAVEDADYLTAHGVDPDAVAEAGERAGEGRGRSPSQRDAIMAALRELDRPTAEEIIEHAGEHGVPPDRVREALDTLRERGRVTETDGRYRLV